VLHGPNANTRKNALKFRSEQRVAIVDQIALAIQNSVHGIGHISADLTHPQSVRIGCYASDFHLRVDKSIKNKTRKRLKPL
jgi:hypothetical protein